MTRESVPELLMPAGGFESALASIEGGADALYLGFAEFSARKQARNFDRLEYRRLYRLARERGLRLYVALNTIVLDGEMEDAAALLAFLGRFPPDAAIVQDWGLAALIRERHPGIAIHASTQAAVQGSEAAKMARELGATRIVLPRETSLAEMRSATEEAPDLEYEAFVHGALCYSFSGLCLASGLVLGRSGNRGECAQLCRSFYDVAGGVRAEYAQPRTGKAGRGYWFSCKDLELADRVSDLARAGIRSLKVEGRMKGPEYCYAVARLYRGILDGLKGGGPGDTEQKSRLGEARTAFSRSPTSGWLDERGGASVVDPEYPGHRGLPAGRVRSSAGARLLVDLDIDLCVRDGLLAFEDDDPFKPQRFSATGIRDPRSGRELLRARAGSRVEIDAPMSDGRAIRIAAGTELRRISSRDMDRRAPSPEEYEPARQNLRVKLSLEAGSLRAELELPRFDGSSSASSTASGCAAIDGDEALPLDRARSPGGFARAIAVFSESGDADFRLCPEIDPDASVKITGAASEADICALSDIFVPPSALKREKNRIYERATRIIAEAERVYAGTSASRRPLSVRGSDHGTRDERLGRPPRAALVFRRDVLPSGMPFAMKRDLVEGSELPRWGGRSWLPLAPLVAARDEYAGLARDRIDRELGNGNSISIGLGSLHHIALAREIVRGGNGARAARESRLDFFLDFGLYIANALAFASLAALLPGIEFAYRYLEAEEGAWTELAPIGEGFEPPLFQSLGCARKHHVEGGSCPPDCSRRWECALRDRDREYLLIVEDCVTMLFRAGSLDGRQHE